MKNEIEYSKQALIEWLSDPRELGCAPENIEYTNMFEEDDNRCYIFKYKKDSSSSWMLGIVSDSGTFSEMQVYNKDTEIDDAKKILDKIKNYWKKMAESYIDSSSDNQYADNIKQTSKVQSLENNTEILPGTTIYINEKDTNVINNEYDYSNIIPTVECVMYLVQYCYDVYKQFINLVEEDTRRNEQLKYEYRNYNYKKSYGLKFNIYIKEKSYNNITCKDFASFQSAVNDGNLKNTNGVEIRFDLDYKRGNEKNLIEYENSFTIIFKPYEIKFARKSNHNEANMNQIETTIKDILSKFPKINSIFCTK